MPAAPTQPPTAPRAHRRLTTLAVVLAAALLLWWRGDGAPPPAAGPDRLPTAAAAQPAEAAERAEPQVRDAALVRETTAEAAAVDLSQPHAFTLRVHAVEQHGLPVPDANVFVAPQQCGFGLAPGATDARGLAAVTLRARAPMLAVWVAVLAQGVEAPLRCIELRSGAVDDLFVVVDGTIDDTTELQDRLAAGYTEQDLRLLLPPDRRAALDAPNRRGRLDRRDPHDFVCGRALALFEQLDCTVCHTPSAIECYQALAWARPLGPRLGSASPFADLRLRPPDEQERAQRRRARLVPSPAEHEQQLRERLGRLGSGLIEGKVRDGYGQLAANAVVAWLGDDGSLLARTTTDELGSYRLRLPARQNAQLTCIADGRGRGSATVLAAAGGTTPADIALGTVGVVRGTTHDAGGAPLVQWFVEAEAGAFGTSLAITQEDGSFAFSHLGASARLLLWARESDLRLPVLVSDLVLPDGPAADLGFRELSPSRARLRVRAVLPAGRAGARVELRLHQLATGRGAHLARTGVDETFELEGLAAGHYQGEIGAQGYGWLAFGPLWLDGRGLFDLGAFPFPRPGRLRLLVPDGAADPLAGEAVLWRRGDGVDVAVDAASAGPHAVELPPGRYALAYRDRGALRTLAFAIESASETALAVPR